MVLIKWIITDDLSNVSVREFEDDWCGIIGGYLELVVNKEEVGFCPEGKIEKEMVGMENVLFWLTQFKIALDKMKSYKDYEMPLLSMNLCKLVMKRQEKVELRFVRKETNEIKWKEELEMQEFEQEVNRNIEKFKNEIQNINPELLTSKWIKKLDT